MIDFGLVDQIESLGWTVDFDEEMPAYEQLKPKEDPPIGKLRKVDISGNGDDRKMLRLEFMSVLVRFTILLCIEGALCIGGCTGRPPKSG